MIQARIHHWAKVDPAKLAVVWNSISLNYLTFSNMIEATRQQLERQRPSTRGTVVVLGHDLLSVWINVIALRSLGFITVAAHSVNQAASLQLKDVVWIVVATGENYPEDDAVKALDSATSSFAMVNHTRSLPPAPALDHLIAVSGDLSAQGGHILYTSGTTGKNKKVLMPGKYDDDLNPTKLAGLVTIDENTVYYGGFFPLYTAAGYGSPLLIWNAGGCVVLEQPLTFENLFKLNTTFTVLIPFHLRALVNRLQRTKAHPKGHFTLMTGGSFVPLELADRIRELVTDDLIIAYGSTESSAGMVMSSKYRSLEDLYWFTPAADRVVQVVNQSGEECAVDEEGDLRVLLKEADCQGYLDDPETSAAMFRDGHFYPGDMAIRRADGRIRIIGRVADVVNFQGFKVAVGPLEQAIRDALEVDEVCAFGAVTKKGEEELLIAIQSRDRKLDADLQERVREIVLAYGSRSISFKLMRLFLFPQFPREETGMRKTKRAVLRKNMLARVDAMA